MESWTCSLTPSTMGLYPMPFLERSSRLPAQCTARGESKLHLVNQATGDNALEVRECNNNSNETPHESHAVDSANGHHA
jgi:hypothetical protein